MTANESYITTSSIFYDAIFIGSPTTNITGNAGAMFVPAEFIREAYSHGKAIAAIGSGSHVLDMIELTADAGMSIYSGGAAAVTSQVLQALMPGQVPLQVPDG